MQRTITTPHQQVEIITEVFLSEERYLKIQPLQMEKEHVRPLKIFIKKHQT